MRDYKSYFRKPVEFNQYHILLVKTHGVWCIDCEAWDESVIRQAQQTEKRFNPEHKTKIVTSPSDDDRVISRIVREMNR